MYVLWQIEEREVDSLRTVEYQVLIEILLSTDVVLFVDDPVTLMAVLVGMANHQLLASSTLEVVRFETAAYL
jgi:hypothetical protein